MSNRRIIVAIDGDAGSGKSTTAKGLAKRLGFVYLDTGAMYRAATLKYLRLGGTLAPVDPAIIRRIIEDTVIELRPGKKGIRILLDGQDVTPDIRTPQINTHVSPVSAVPELRVWMVEKQRAAARGRDVVCEGRDIGTVVFPDAQVKIFMKADLPVRARRRALELSGGKAADLDPVIKNLEFRDRYDSNRPHSPLKQTADAVLIDTTDLTIEQEIALAARIVRAKINDIKR